VSLNKIIVEAFKRAEQRGREQEKREYFTDDEMYDNGRKDGLRRAAEIAENSTKIFTNIQSTTAFTGKAIAKTIRDEANDLNKP